MVLEMPRLTSQRRKTLIEARIPFGIRSQSMKEIIQKMKLIYGLIK